VRATSRWLLFVHQLPSSPSNLRVRTWRRLQQIGALPVKQAVYVLPDTAIAREDFEWLKTEIESAGGQASVFAADAVDAWSNDALVEEFRRSREASYRSLAEDADRLFKQRGRRAGAAVPRRALQQLKERLAAIERVDFFASAGRDRVVSVIEQLEQQGRTGRSRLAGADPSTPTEYHARLWVTRPRPGIDRLASAWLIRRFIDPEAHFAFAADREAVPRQAVPFDMFGVELTHRGESCTFETLCEVFELRDPALPAIAAIVHDIDLKDGRFGAPEAPAIDLLVAGLRLTHADDDVLLDAGMSLFEALYRALTATRRVMGPRPVARKSLRRKTPRRGRSR
jgi:hypothetical protein